jgi:mRNA interferase MazF
VWWVQLDPTLGSELQKTRPCMVVTSDVVNARRRTVVVAPLSTGPRVSPPLLIALSSVGEPTVAVLDQLRAVTKERFRERLGTVSPAELDAVESGLREILEL